MLTKRLVFLWGLLASCLVLSADGITIPSLGEIAANFQESRFLDIDHFEEPTEQEWIEIITETRQGNSLPKYLAEKNYTFHVEETGEFSNTEGGKGSWSSTKYMFYEVTDSHAMRFILNVKSLEVGDSHYKSGSGLITMFTFFKQSYVSAHALFGMSFVKNDNLLEKREKFHGFGHGESEYLGKDRVPFYDYGLMLVNRSDVLSISDVEYGGTITVDKDIYHLEGGLFRNSIPLNTVDVAGLPKNPEDLASFFRATKASTPYLASTTGRVSGEQTVGEVGYYKGDIDTVTSIFPDRKFNTTATVKAIYNNKQTDAHLLIQDLIDINTPFLG